jgi:hypothetical protein
MFPIKYLCRPVDFLVAGLCLFYILVVEGADINMLILNVGNNAFDRCRIHVNSISPTKTAFQLLIANDFIKEDFPRCRRHRKLVVSGRRLICQVEGKHSKVFRTWIRNIFERKSKRQELPLSYDKESLEIDIQMEESRLDQLLADRAGQNATTPKWRQHLFRNPKQVVRAAWNQAVHTQSIRRDIGPDSTAAPKSKFSGENPFPVARDHADRLESLKLDAGEIAAMDSPNVADLKPSSDGDRTVNHTRELDKSEQVSIRISSLSNQQISAKALSPLQPKDTIAQDSVSPIRAIPYLLAQTQEFATTMLSSQQANHDVRFASTQPVTSVTAESNSPGVQELWLVIKSEGLAVRSAPNEMGDVIDMANYGDLLDVAGVCDLAEGGVWLRLREAWQWRRDVRAWRRVAEAWVKKGGGNESSGVNRAEALEAAQIGRRGRGLWKVCPGGVRVMDQPDPGAREVRPQRRQRL